jgi:hypothetical protein
MQAFEDRVYESRGIREASWISLGRCHPNQLHATRGCAPRSLKIRLKGFVCAFGVHRQQLNAGGEMVLTSRSHASSVPPKLDPQLLHVGQIGASASGREDAIVKRDVGVEGT